MKKRPVAADVAMQIEANSVEKTVRHKSLLQQVISEEVKAETKVPTEASATEDGFAKPAAKLLKTELEENKIVRDSNAAEFAISFTDHLQKGYILQEFEAVVNADSLVSRYKYDPNHMTFKAFSDVLYLMHQDAATVNQELTNWLQKGIQPINMFTSNGVWLLLGGKQNNSYGSLVTKCAILIANTTSELMTSLKHYCINGYIMRCGGYANDTWILVLERRDYPFQWQWSCYQSLATAQQAARSQPQIVWIGPIFAGGYFYMFAYKKISPTSTT
jgi:hypothetical protein